MGQRGRESVAPRRKSGGGTTAAQERRRKTRQERDVERESEHSTAPSPCANGDRASRVDISPWPSPTTPPPRAVRQARRVVRVGELFGPSAVGRGRREGREGQALPALRLGLCARRHSGRGRDPWLRSRCFPAGAAAPLPSRVRARECCRRSPQNEQGGGGVGRRAESTSPRPQIPCESPSCVITTMCCPPARLLTGHQLLHVVRRLPRAAVDLRQRRRGRRQVVQSHRQGQVEAEHLPHPQPRSTTTQRCGRPHAVYGASLRDASARTCTPPYTTPPRLPPPSGRLLPGGCARGGAGKASALHRRRSLRRRPTRASAGERAPRSARAGGGWGWRTSLTSAASSVAVQPLWPPPSGMSPTSSARAACRATSYRRRKRRHTRRGK